MEPGFHKYFKSSPMRTGVIVAVKPGLGGQGTDRQTESGVRGSKQAATTAGLSAPVAHSGNG